MKRSAVSSSSNNSNGKSNSKGNSFWHWTQTDTKFCVCVCDVEGISATQMKITLSHNWIFGQRKCRQIPFDVIVLKFGIYAHAHMPRSPPIHRRSPSIEHTEHSFPSFFPFALFRFVCASATRSSSSPLFVYLFFIIVKFFFAIQYIYKCVLSIAVPHSPCHVCTNACILYFIRAHETLNLLTVKRE